MFKDAKFYQSLFLKGLAEGKEMTRAEYEYRCVEVIEEYWGSYWSIVAYKQGVRYSDIGLAYMDFNLDEKIWYRFGKCPENPDPIYEGQYTCSWNKMGNCQENGISVLNKEYVDSIFGAMLYHSGRPLYAVRGIQVGRGQDGEPVIIPTSAEMKIEDDIDEVLKNI